MSVIVLLAWVSARAQAERARDVGLVSYREFTQAKGDAYFRSAVKPLFERIAEHGLEPEWVSIDIFLPVNQPARDQFRRIVIPGTAHWFTEEMYEGMADYVRAGGLLLTLVPLCGIDVNRDYTQDNGDRWMSRPGNEVVGVHGHSGVTAAKARVEMVCPLTTGLAPGEWLQLERPLNVRMTTNASATVLMTSDAVYKGKPHRDQPFVTFKHAGRGACIYLPCGLRSDEKHIAVLTRNALSRQVLEWLTAGE